MVDMKRCALCGMRAFYVLGDTPLCKTHGDDHKRAQVKVKVPDNIRMAWRYWDTQKFCYHYTLEEIRKFWRPSAYQVRVRVTLEYKGRILKCEVVQ